MHFRQHSRIKLHRKSTDASRSGVTVVEFAVMAPIIFTLFIGAIEITRLNFIRNTAANACYEGARKGILPGATSSEASSEAKRLLDMLGVGKGAKVDVVTDNESVTVTAQIPLNQNSWGVTRFTSGLQVTQSCQLSRENF